MTSPYTDLPNHQFWARAVANVPPHELDPVVHSELFIRREDLVATMGSCFAQHISRHLQATDRQFFVTETAPPGTDPEEADRRGFGVYSARYGNVYTTRQALQLFDRAFGAIQPADDSWTGAAGGYVDPFRPRIEPEGFATIDALHHERERHMSAVRRVFTECNVLVFTLGLTETWASRVDGSVFPLAPGVAGGCFDPTRYVFVNLRVADVIADLQALAARFRSVNPAGAILLTVSPVPLVATYEDRHVLVSTVASKSVLRVAAEEVCRQHPFVHYFPSYEIITAPGEIDRYFEPNLRSVNPDGVAHVMRVFDHHCFGTEARTTGVDVEPASIEQRFVSNVLCDEESMDPT